MALKAILDSIDDAPEPLREHYAERDGKFYLAVDAVGGYALEDVSGLKSALGKERTTREKLESSIKKFGDLDPDTVHSSLAKLAELDGIDPTKEADKIVQTKVEAAIKQLTGKHEAALTEKTSRIGFLEGAVADLLINASATAALAEAKGSVDLLLPHVRNAAKVKEVDGKFVVEVTDKDGNVLLDNKGAPISIKDYVAELRKSDTYARAFDGEGQSGSGTPAGGGTGGQPKGDLGGSRADRAKHFASKLGVPVA